MPLYGFVTPDMSERAFKALGVGNKPLARLLAFMVDKIRTGNRLKEFEQQQLVEYLFAHEKYDTPFESLLTVQMSQQEVAEAIFDGHPQSANNALRQLCDSGLAEIVFKGRKGHSTLYLVGAIQSSINNENLTECAKLQTPLSETFKPPPSGKYSVKIDTKWSQRIVRFGQKSIYIRSSRSLPTRKDNLISISNPDSKPESDPELGAKHSIRCPTCGSSNIALKGREYVCECGYGWATPASLQKRVGRQL